MTHLILFGSSFALVFLLGLQSLSVNGGHERAAIFNSCCIGLMNIVMFKLAPDASLTESACYVIGGPIGIVASMRFFRRYRRFKK